MLSWLSFLFLWSKLSSFLFLVLPPSGRQHHYFDVKPRTSTVPPLKLAIWALCLSQPKCLLSMKLEVMNVTISVEEQVASIITDNCQLCLGNPVGALWHPVSLSLSVWPFSWCWSPLLLYCLRLSRLTFMGHDEIENSFPKDETWVRMATNDDGDEGSLNFSISRDAVADAQVSQRVSVSSLWSVKMELVKWF